MAFLYARGHINPVITYYYDSGAQLRFKAWHFMVAMLFAVIAIMAGSFRVASSHLTFDIEPPLKPPAAAAVVLPAPVEELKPVAVPKKETSLQADIDAWLATHKGVDWSVAVQSMDGKTSAAVHPDDVYTLASIYKLFLLQPLANKIPSSQWAKTAINGQTYASCVDAMIRVSDNACAEAIGSSLNWVKAQNYLRTLGYSKTAFVGNPTTIGTVAETTRLLKNLYTSNGFDALTRSSALDAMLAPKRTEGIRPGCNGCTVYNKIGDLAGYHNDAAIVEKNGKTYTVVIFSKTASWSQIAELTRVIAKHL